MSELRSTLSEKNPYWISKHRYYELKHFCLQYPYWKKVYAEGDGLVGNPVEVLSSATGEHSDPTVKIAAIMMYCSERMDMIHEAAQQADPELATYIVAGVTQGMNYDTLRMKMAVPCCRDVYYDRYRKFFWHLHHLRN